jgi:hypothetical protein
MPNGPLTFTKVEPKEYVSKKDGQTRTLYNATSAEGTRFTVFGKHLATHIEAHLNEALECEWEEKQSGEYTNRTINGIAGVEKPRYGGGVDEDRADRRAALAAAAAGGGETRVVLLAADVYLAWLRGDTQTSAGVAPRALPVTHDRTPAEPSPTHQLRNPWNEWIEMTFPHLDLAEHRKLVKAALATQGLEKLPEFDSDAGDALREVVTK